MIMKQFRKYFRLVILSLIVTTSALTEIWGQGTRVLSYNIRLDIKSDGEDNWDHRKNKMADLLTYYEPAIFGIQEGLPNQVAFIDSCLTRYSYIGVGRDDGINRGEYCAIFYDTSKFKVISQSNFWLSETPGEAAYVWDAAYRRICTLVLFENLQSQKRMWVFNTHFDNEGAVARKKSAELIVSRINELNIPDLPVIVMGDLNALPDAEPVRILKSELNDGKEIAARPFYGPEGTFNGFSDKPVINRIDYIFCKQINVVSYIHIDDRRKNNLQISDHLPVMVILDL